MQIFDFVVADRDNVLKKELTVSLVGDMAVPPVTKNSSIPQWAIDTRRRVHDFVLHYGDIGKPERVSEFY